MSVKACAGVGQASESSVPRSLASCNLAPGLKDAFSSHFNSSQQAAIAAVFDKRDQISLVQVKCCPLWMPLCDRTGLLISLMIFLYEHLQIHLQLIPTLQQYFHNPHSRVIY
jgi:hypothetical protein